MVVAMEVVVVEVVVGDMVVVVMAVVAMEEVVVEVVMEVEASMGGSGGSHHTCTPCWFVAYDASRFVCSRRSAVSPTTQEHTSASCCAAKSIVRPCASTEKHSQSA